MPYIGRSSNFGVRTRFLYTATASQTTFSGTDTQNLTLSYSDSNFIDVHQNGVLLKVVDDYTATSGTSVVLATGATASDVIEITVYDVFSIANHIKKTGDAMAGALTNIDIDGTELVLDSDGDTSITADTDDQIDIRIGGADDFAFKANKFEVQTGSNIDMNGTELILDADGDTSIQASSDDIIVFDTGGSERARLDGSGNLFVSATATSGFQSSSSESGSIIYGAGGIASNSASNDVPAVFNRLGNDGSIIQLKKDGSTVGLIGSTSGAVTHIVLDPRSSSAKGSGLVGGSIDANTGLINPTDNSGAVSDGNITLGSSSGRFKDLYLSGGLYVGGTWSANYLDDYEEGTWSPTHTGGSGTGSFTGNNYTKIGRLVHIQFGFSFSSGSGNMAIGNLPFTANNTGVGIGREDQSTGYGVYGKVNTSGTEMTIFATQASGNATAYQTSNGTIRYSMTYFTDS